MLKSQVLSAVSYLIITLLKVYFIYLVQQFNDLTVQAKFLWAWSRVIRFLFFKAVHTQSMKPRAARVHIFPLKFEKLKLKVLYNFWTIIKSTLFNPQDSVSKFNFFNAQCFGLLAWMDSSAVGIETFIGFLLRCNIIKRFFPHFPLAKILMKRWRAGTQRDSYTHLISKPRRWICNVTIFFASLWNSRLGYLCIRVSFDSLRNWIK